MKYRITFEYDNVELFDAIKGTGGYDEYNSRAVLVGQRLLTCLLDPEITFRTELGIGYYGIRVVSIEETVTTPSGHTGLKD